MAQLHKNIGFAGIGQFIYTVLAFALIPFASRYLGDEGFGIYSLATAIGFFVALFTDLGIATLLTREISKHPRIAQPLFATFMGVKSLLVLISIAILLLYLRVGDFDTISIHSILIFSIASILLSYTQNAFSVFRGFEKIQYESIGMSVEKLLSVVLGILFLVLKWDIRIFISSFLIAAIIKLIMSFYILKRQFIPIAFSVRLHRSRILLLHSIPFGISVLLAVCYNYMDILMLHAMTTMQVVGWYSGSYKFLSLTTQVNTVLTTAFLPQLSKTARQIDALTSLFLKGVTMIFMISMPMVPVVLLYADWMVMTLLGGQFQGSIVSLKLLVFAAFAQMLNSFFVAMYAAINKQKIIIYFQIVGLILNLVFNLILIPVISYRGAAIATIVTEWSILLLTIFWAVKYIFSQGNEWKRFGGMVLRLAGSTALTTLSLWLLRRFHCPDFPALVIGFAVYVLCLQVLGVIDFRALSQSFTRFVTPGNRS